MPIFETTDGAMLPCGPESRSFDPCRIVAGGPPAALTSWSRPRRARKWFDIDRTNSNRPLMGPAPPAAEIEIER